EGNENLVYVPPVVTGILFLLRHHADYDGREIVQINVLTHWIAARKKLLRGVAAEKRQAAAFAGVVPVVKSPLSHRQAANLLKRRFRTGNQQGGIVEIAVGANVF